MRILALLAVAHARNASTLRAPATCKLAPCWRCMNEGTAGCCRAPRPKKHAPTCECGAGGLGSSPIGSAKRNSGYRYPSSAGGVTKSHSGLATLILGALAATRALWL